MRILLAGVGRDATNYRRTVAQPVPLDQLLPPATTVTQRQLLEAKHGRDGQARFWSISANNSIAQAAARELQPGDQVFFHAGGRVFAVAEVVTVIPGAHGIVSGLWPGWGGTIAFTVTPPCKASIGKADVNALLGFSPSYTWQQGPLLLNVCQSTMLASRVGLALLPEDPQKH
jgi:hypothetical protein